MLKTSPRRRKVHADVTSKPTGGYCGPARTTKQELKYSSTLSRIQYFSPKLQMYSTFTSDNIFQGLCKMNLSPPRSRAQTPATNSNATAAGSSMDVAPSSHGSMRSKLPSREEQHASFHMTVNEHNAESAEVALRSASSSTALPPLTATVTSNPLSSPVGAAPKRTSSRATSGGLDGMGTMSRLSLVSVGEDPLASSRIRKASNVRHSTRLEPRPERFASLNDLFPRPLARTPQPDDVKHVGSVQDMESIAARTGRTITATLAPIRLRSTTPNPVFSASVRHRMNEIGWLIDGIVVDGNQ
eukprot:PhM_4_TR17426/c0_g1_i2/m.77937